MKTNKKSETLTASPSTSCSAILAVMAENPRLTYEGFSRLSGNKDGLGNPINAEGIKERKELLMKAGCEIDACRKWIVDRCQQRKTINRRLGSYGLKHLIENDAGVYVSNGSCIAAFILEGYRLHHPENWGLNCAFDVKVLNSLSNADV